MRGRVKGRRKEKRERREIGEGESWGLSGTFCSKVEIIFYEASLLHVKDRNKKFYYMDF